MTDTPADPLAPDEAAALREQLATANARLIQAELKSHALRAGIIDLDCLKLLDASSLKLDPEGNVTGGTAALANLKRDKPWAFTRPNSSHPAPPPSPELPKSRTAKEMTYEEWQAARARLIKPR